MDNSTASTSFSSAPLSCHSLSSATEDNMINDTPQPQYLKLEDLQSAGSPAPLDNSPASVIIHSRPTKKRKSWGQELPEPKTTLPPRKRAKTDDEKEQRRIERIKRNRAAAHNSRERKRQETENLAVLLARARAELDAYRRLHGPLPDDIVLPEVTLSKEEYESQSPSQDSSNNNSRDSPAPSLPSPATTLLDSNISIKSEPVDTVMPLSLFDESEAALPALDLTQHSAEMLCSDLPCQSSQLAQLRPRRKSPRKHALSNSSSRSQLSARQTRYLQSWNKARWWTRLFTYLIHLQTQTAYHQILLSLWTISPSRMEPWIKRTTPQHSTTHSVTTPSSSTTSSTLMPYLTQQQLRSTFLLLAQLKGAATSRSARQLQQLQSATSTARREHDMDLERRSIDDDGMFKDRPKRI